ncbi:collagen alpha-1(XIV) chain-like isoform X2 [Lineus longissimus]|uniref:collagen alpha-1(XIV) chain-like isoform X2 n=1 Tax=Lineus longissimus TaxID=88925 RepID=UPI00315DF480
MIIMVLPRVLVFLVVVSVILLSKVATTTAPTGVGSICKFQVDVAFLLDGSGSVTDKDFLIMLNFVEKVVTKYTIGQDAALIAAVLFSTRSTVKFDFTNYTTKNDLLKAIKGIRHPGGSTAIDLGLRDIRTKIFTATGGHRAGIPQVLVVMTDGRANSRLHLKAEADLVKAQGIDVFAFGIGNRTDDVLLQEIASDSSKVFRVHNFKLLVNFIGTLAQKICSEAMTTPKTTPARAGPACSYTFENGICRGHDIWSSKVSFVQCRDTCNRRADCKSFQYRKPTCWLKNFVCSKSQLMNVGHTGFAQYTSYRLRLNSVN